MEKGRAYFLTFSTYGSRLPGREKGSYRWDSRFIKPNRGLYAYVEKRLNEPSVEFSLEERALVHDALMECARRFSWKIDALNVRKEHVHIVLFAPSDESPDEIVRKLKTGATYALYENNFRGVGTRVWTKSFACDSIWTIGFWRRAVNYVLKEQGSNFYLRLSQFGQTWIRRIRASQGAKKYDVTDLYGGRDRATERAVFFRRLAKQRIEQS